LQACSSQFLAGFCSISKRKRNEILYSKIAKFLALFSGYLSNELSILCFISFLYFRQTGRALPYKVRLKTSIFEHNKSLFSLRC
jgi:hypothetical protein